MSLLKVNHLTVTRGEDIALVDMGRSAINVLGNGIATAMLSKNEGLLQEEVLEAEAEPQQVEA